MDEDTLKIGFLISAPAFFIVSLICQGIFLHLFAMAESGNVFYEVLGIAGLAYAAIGGIILVILTISILVCIVIFFIVFFFPAYLIYTLLGLEYSIILVVILSAIAIIYFIETHTVSIEHYTIVLNPQKRYIIKR